VTRVALTLAPISAELPDAHGDARRTWAARHGVLVRAEAEGRVGYGEASPLPGRSQETLGDALGALSSSSLDLDLGAPASVLAPTLSAPSLPPSARFGLETAVFDLCAQLRSQPLARWLHPAAASSVALQLLVDPTRPDRLERVLAQGPAAVKVKLGRRGEAAAEIHALHWLRSRAPLLEIRADASSAPLTPELRRALAEVGCTLLEDPAAPVPGVPLMLDELLAGDRARALDLLANGEARAAVLKPTVLGGITRTLALAEAILARAPETTLVVSHALESPIGLSAAAHLAAVLSGGASGRTHGVAPWSGLERFEVEGRPVPVPGWLAPPELVLPAAPGLGAAP
jgi:O-succinylbenzoate synthase